ERLTAAFASWNYFDALRVKPTLGRGFAPDEDLAGNNKVVVLSHGFWQRRFNSSPEAIGQALTLSGSSFTVIGVLPPDFQSPLELQFAAQIEVWSPAGFAPANLDRGSHGLNVLAGLPPGESLQQAQAKPAIIIGRVVSENPGFYPTGEGSFSSLVEPLQTNLVGNVRTPLIILLAAVIAVLLIA